jgi:AraC-like DNA-binding protein
VKRIRIDSKYSSGFFAAKREMKLSYEEHFHDHTELTLVVKGYASHVINGHMVKAKPGDVFILKPGVAHSFPSASGFVHYVFSYSDEMLEFASQDLKGSPAFQALFALGRNMESSGFDAMLSLSLDSIGKAEAIVAGLLTELKGRELGFESLAKARFMELLVFLCREYERQGPRSGAPLDVERAARLASLIESSFAKPLSLAAAAKGFGVCERQLRRIFRKHYGCAPLEYLMRTRLKKAAGLLDSGGMTLAEIAFACGFSDANYFSHQFKKSLGISPSSWRSRPSLRSADRA